jgi:hypothetical protein
LFANRFTAFLDACTLASVLKRNLLLSLAEAEFFRLRWSKRVLDETEGALEKIHAKRGHTDAADRAKRARKSMEVAFEDAMVATKIFSKSLEICPTPVMHTSWRQH